MQDLKVTVDSAHLEDLLECLAELKTPIDPRIEHGPNTVVRFPVAEDQSSFVRRALRFAGFRRVSIDEENVAGPSGQLHYPLVF